MLSITRFHQLRFCAAILALTLALLYLAGHERPAMAGFFLLGLYAVYVSLRLRKGGHPARCDLCRGRALLKVEYEAGFVNTHLVLECPRCGRVINAAASGVRPAREPKPPLTSGKKK